jgi:hypothetical protein
MTWVELAPCEVRHAALVGVGRYLAARAQGRRDLFVTDRGSLFVDLIGAFGEITVAKALGVFWSPNVGGNDSGPGDVMGLQVRASVRASSPLVIRPRDHDESAFVLVTGEPPCLCIRGWLYAADGKRPEYWQTRHNIGPAAYFVPADELQPWDERPKET